MKTFLADCRHGKFLLLTGDMISEHMKEYGVWAEPEVGLCLDILAHMPGDMVEAGPFIGTHTVPLARAAAATGHHVLAVEPQRVIHQVLCANLALNNLTNVHAVHGAAVPSALPFPLFAQDSDYSVPWNYGAFSINKGFNSEKPFPGPTTRRPVQRVIIDYAYPIDSQPH